MTSHSARNAARDPRDPFSHELAAIRCDGSDVAVTLHVRCDAQGMWRGRLEFQSAESGASGRATAEIFCGHTERDVWLAAAGLGEFHMRDLYRAVE